MAEFLIFGFVNFKEEQVPPVTVEASAGQLVFL